MVKWILLFCFLCLLFLPCQCARHDIEVERRQQRVEIKFMWLLGLSTVEIIRRLRQCHAQAALCAATVYWWVRQLKDGRTTLRDLPKIGRPTKLTRDKIRRIRNELDTDPTLSLKEISRCVGLGVATVHKCVRKNLHLKK